jgi:hypothetical protein|tara:strand:- start:23 stop:328 length:306 start_codon:yes stop_codon:yes gene_type:complete
VLFEALEVDLLTPKQGRWGSMLRAEPRSLTLLLVALSPSMKSKTRQALSALPVQGSERSKESIQRRISGWQVVLCAPVKPAGLLSLLVNPAWPTVRVPVAR